MSSTVDKQIEVNSAYIYVEQTLAIIKPDAIHKADEIEEMILKHGFAILRVSIAYRHVSPPAKCVVDPSKLLENLPSLRRNKKFTTIYAFVYEARRILALDVRRQRR